MRLRVWVCPTQNPKPKSWPLCLIFILKLIPVMSRQLNLVRITSSDQLSARAGAAAGVCVGASASAAAAAAATAAAVASSGCVLT